MSTRTQHQVQWRSENLRGGKLQKTSFTSVSEMEKFLGNLLRKRQFTVVSIQRRKITTTPWEDVNVSELGIRT